MDISLFFKRHINEIDHFHTAQSKSEIQVEY